MRCLYTAHKESNFFSSFACALFSLAERARVNFVLLIHIQHTILGKDNMSFVKKKKIVIIFILEPQFIGCKVNDEGLRHLDFV